MIILNHLDFYEKKFLTVDSTEDQSSLDFLLKDYGFDKKENHPVKNREKFFERLVKFDPLFESISEDFKMHLLNSFTYVNDMHRNYCEATGQPFFYPSFVSVWGHFYYYFFLIIKQKNGLKISRMEKIILLKYINYYLIYESMKKIADPESNKFIKNFCENVFESLSSLKTS